MALCRAAGTSAASDLRWERRETAKIRSDFSFCNIYCHIRRWCWKSHSVHIYVCSQQTLCLVISQYSQRWWPVPMQVGAGRRRGPFTDLAWGCPEAKWERLGCCLQLRTPQDERLQALSTETPRTPPGWVRSVNSSLLWAASTRFFLPLDYVLIETRSTVPSSK